MWRTICNDSVSHAYVSHPDSKVHGANMGPPGSCRPQMGPMLAQWTSYQGNHSGNVYDWVIYTGTCIHIWFSVEEIWGHARPLSRYCLREVTYIPDMRRITERASLRQSKHIINTDLELNPTLVTPRRTIITPKGTMDLIIHSGAEVGIFWVNKIKILMPKFLGAMVMIM